MTHSTSGSAAPDLATRKFEQNRHLIDEFVGFYRRLRPVRPRSVDVVVSAAGSALWHACRESSRENLRPYFYKIAIREADELVEEDLEGIRVPVQLKRNIRRGWKSSAGKEAIYAQAEKAMGLEVYGGDYLAGNDIPSPGDGRHARDAARERLEAIAERLPARHAEIVRRLAGLGTPAMTRLELCRAMGIGTDAVYKHLKEIRVMARRIEEYEL